MKSKVILENGSDVWDSKKRYKVNQSVLFNGVSYQNTTGANSSPDLLVDWVLVDNIGVYQNGTRTTTVSADDVQVYDSAIERQGVFNEFGVQCIKDGSKWTKLTFEEPTAQGDILVPKFSGARSMAFREDVLNKTQYSNKTTTEINAIASPVEGEQYYNTTLHTICFYNGTNWQKVTSTNM